MYCIYTMILSPKSTDFQGARKLLKSANSPQGFNSLQKPPKFMIQHTCNTTLLLMLMLFVLLLLLLTVLFVVIYENKQLAINFSLFKNNKRALVVRRVVSPRRVVCCFCFLFCFCSVFYWTHCWNAALWWMMCLCCLCFLWLL